MRVELIRHGETEWMKNRRYQGRTDVPLSEEGIRRLRPAGFHPAQIYVSGMKRADQTAEAIFPGVPRIAVPGLAEMDFGVFEGRTADEMADDAAYRTWVDGMCMGACPEGESTDGFCDRVCSAFAALMDRLCEDPDAKDCIIVAHGGTAMAVMDRYADIQRSFYEWHLKSGCGFILEGNDWKSRRTLHFLGESDYNRNSKNGD